MRGRQQTSVTWVYYFVSLTLLLLLIWLSLYLFPHCSILEQINSPSMPLFRLDIFWHFLQLNSRFVGTKQLLHMHILFPEKTQTNFIRSIVSIYSYREYPNPPGLHTRSEQYISRHTYDIYTCIIMDYIPQIMACVHLRQRWRCAALPDLFSETAASLSGLWPTSTRPEATVEGQLSARSSSAGDRRWHRVVWLATKSWGDKTLMHICLNRGVISSWFRQVRAW
jgi:hypothetical protein